MSEKNPETSLLEEMRGCGSLDERSSLCYTHDVKYVMPPPTGSFSSTGTWRYALMSSERDGFFLEGNPQLSQCLQGDALCRCPESSGDGAARLFWKAVRPLRAP